MVERYTQGKLTWVDAMNPTTDELRELISEFKIEPVLLTDASAQGSHPLATTTGKALKLILHFPIVKRKDLTRPHEIELIATKHTLISIRYEEIEAIHRFKKEFEVITMLYKTNKSATGGHLLYSLLRELYTSLDLKLDYVESQMPDIETGIYEGREKEMVSIVSELTRKVMTFKHIVRVHDELLSEAAAHAETCFGKGVAEGIHELHTRLARVIRRTNNVFEMVVGLRETNMALLTIKQNEVMKILTIMAFITFPLTLFTSMFGMNTENTPIIGLDSDFWIIVLIMSGITLSFFGFFKYKHWM